MPLLASPLALLGLALVPALAAIYFLRHRVRRIPVSTLFLWRDARPLPEGGVKLQKLSTPILFFLELLALFLLIAAAAGPLTSCGGRRTPLVVVLDDSYSMRAGGKGSALEKARAALVAELSGTRHRPITLVLAGSEPQSLGEPAASGEDAARRLRGWTAVKTQTTEMGSDPMGWLAGAPEAKLHEAVLLARELAGRGARLLVVTDHLPATLPEAGAVEWWAFGRALPNLAIVNAARADDTGFAEIAAFVEKAVETELVVETLDGRPLSRLAVSLAPGQRRKLTLKLPAGLPVRLRLPEDALPDDDQAILLPTGERKARVAVRLADAAVKDLVEKAVLATGRAVLTAERVDLVIGDAAASDATASEGDAWTVAVASERNGASAYAGPFVLDRTHPLSNGLGLDGVVWGASAVTARGRTVVAAGSVPLLVDAESANGRHQLSLALVPSLSTLPLSPAWPALVWNLVDWRLAKLPGPESPNVRLGALVVVNVPHGVDAIGVTDPAKRRRAVPVVARQAAFRPASPGLHEVAWGETRHPVSVLAANAEESDLGKAVTGTRVGTAADLSRRAGLHPLTGILGLAALAVLTLHRWLVSRSAEATA